MFTSTSHACLFIVQYKWALELFKSRIPESFDLDGKDILICTNTKYFYQVEGVGAELISLYTSNVWIVSKTN